MSSRRRALILGCLLAGLTACQPAATRVGAPHPAASPVPTLAGAVATFFANHYDVSERDFRSIVAASPGDAEAHARLALQLNYEQRFPEALAEAATAVRLAPRDALVAAVATRVKDWSSDNHDPRALAAAVADGARAVQLGPKLVLAHAFYAEALADYGLAAGDKASSQRSASELDLAAGLGSSDPYDRSEIERERANLAADNQDTASQLTHLEAARQLMPGWVERTREIAEWYLGQGMEDRWQAEIAHAVSLAPDDFQLRVSLGTVALDKEDVSLADQSFAAANRIRPHDAGVEATLATTGFCLRRDQAGTEALLRQALADAPDSESIGLLLQGFLRYIERNSDAADAVAVGRDQDPPRPGAHEAPTLAEVRADAAGRALAAVNAARAKAHLPPVALDDRISAGAESHAYWFVFNLCRPEVKGLGIHHEVSATPGFTGYSMRDRASFFGYPPAAMAEDITHRGDPEGAIADWVDSVFHRFPIMRADLTQIGFGEAMVADLPIEVMDMGYTGAAADVRTITPFPADGQTGVPVAFAGNELPDPVPKGGTYPTGYPITVNFAPDARVAISDYRVLDPAGAALALYVLQPTPAGTENVLSMLPRAPLHPGSRYRVHVAGTINGSPFALDYAFTTVSA
jgi:tetratricopeptide (TPR) repeat protein